MPRENRADRVAVRLLPAERRALDELAEARGELVSETVRAILADAIRTEERRRGRRGDNRSTVRPAAIA